MTKYKKQIEILNKLGEAIQDLHSLYFDLEYKTEPEKITCQGTINTGELSEETKKQLENIVWNSPYVSEIKPPRINNYMNPPTEYQELSRRKNYNQSLNKPKMEKKIIGYRLKDEKYKKFADKLVDTELIGNDSNTMDFNLNGMWFIKFREAGVLELWFNPVYEEEKTVPEDYTGWLTYKEETKWLKYFKNGKHQYGFDNNGDWTEVFKGCIISTFANGHVPATSKFVEEAMTKEAIKRGYGRGTTIKGMKHGIEHRLIGNGTCFGLGSNYLAMAGHGIFDNGQWAEIIKTNTLPEIGGYQGEDKGNYIEYGCTQVPKSLIQGMSDLGITSFNLKVDGKKIKVSKAQTKQLFDYINNQ